MQSRLYVLEISQVRRWELCKEGRENIIFVSNRYCTPRR